MLPPSVLCIDHNAAVLSALSVALRDAGYTALTAHSTSQAIRALAYIHFEAIIIDPQHIKLQSIADVLDTFSPGAKILLHSTVAALEKCTDDWGHAIVTKPAEPATVVCELEFLLAQYGRPLPKRETPERPLTIN